METIEIVITKEDFKLGTGFFNPRNCPLAMAAKRALKRDDLSVGAYSIGIEDSDKIIGTIEPQFGLINYYGLKDGKITEFRTIFTPVKEEVLG